MSIIQSSDAAVYPWMDIAVCELGEHELAGFAANKRIAEYLRGIGANESDETPWCSAFVNWVLKRAGYAVTGRANARSWMSYGEYVQYPRYGAIAVFWRATPAGSLGHVAFYLRTEGANIKVLGGNQDNSVCAALYPRARLLGYRWPVRDSGI